MENATRDIGDAVQEGFTLAPTALSILQQPAVQAVPASDDVVVSESYTSREDGRFAMQPREQQNLPANSGTRLVLAVVLSVLVQAKPIVNSARNVVAHLCQQLSSLLGLDRLLAIIRDVGLKMRRRWQVTLNAGTLKTASVISTVAFAYWYSKQGKRNKNRPRAKRVAVVGSGVAGTGAAWSLNRAGIDVVLYEKKPKVGGNAKSMEWDVNGEKVETGLAVLAWPNSLFHNYNAMIEELGIETEYHDTRFYVSERAPDGSTKCVFAHGKEGFEPEEWLRKDLKLWDSLVVFTKRVNSLLHSTNQPSLYHMSFFNFLNMIPLRKLCVLWGISPKFWENVFVPIHTSTFLEVNMDTIPASMAELLDEIVPFSRTPNMRTWKTHAYDAIKALLKNINPHNIRTSCAVETVKYCPRAANADNNVAEGFDIIVVDEDDHEEVFDAIIFACSAQSMNRILHGKGEPLPGTTLVANDINGLNNESSIMGVIKAKAFNWLETTLLSKTLYTTDRDNTFERGIVHSDSNAVLPSAMKNEVLADYCNYIEVDSRNPVNLENTFVISSWAPTTQAPHVKGKLPMLVTYNADKKLKGSNTEWVSTSREAHPCLTFLQLGSSVILWPMLQGARRNSTYFCGSAVLPANGHDLSFLSGLIAASELGASYPFPNNENANADFLRLRHMMLGICA